MFMAEGNISTVSSPSERSSAWEAWGVRTKAHQVAILVTFALRGAVGNETFEPYFSTTAKLFSITSSELEPTITLNSPGSTTNFISRL